MNLIKNTFKKGKLKSIPILPPLTALLLLKNLLRIRLSENDSTNYESIRREAIDNGLASETDFMDANH